MSSVIPVRDYWKSYLKWVEDNPKLASDAENALRYISYLVLGK